MIKQQELSDLKSCLNRAVMDEMLFVLLGRDPAAPIAIRAWIEERLRIGKNKPGDQQIIDAELCAISIENKIRQDAIEANRTLPDQLDAVRRITKSNSEGS